jgi:anaerobic magnesium-protoporphyrin IX monomethyl ester cyclase
LPAVARLFLLNPKTGETVRTPLLSFLYLAAALQRAGHEVALLDLSAPEAPQDFLERIRDFAPDLIGVHCKTLYARETYALARELKSLCVPLVCGGPHPTVVPLEPLAHGFDYSVAGEGEETLVELCDALDGKRELSTVRSLIWRDTSGLLQLNPSRGFLLDLDALAEPSQALHLFDPSWYGSQKTVPPAGLLASRGCPAACTFCSNNVTGRRFRYRSPGGIAREILDFGLTAFSFFDDSFAVGKRRMAELCGELQRLPRKIYWTCTAHPAHLDKELMLQMQRAGCTGIDIGMESADPSMLLRIGKGIEVEQVLEVLLQAKSIGLHCMVNLMFGWPDETLAELRATVDFIERAAPLASSFNARGVLVPYPGTAIYDRHHARFGFTDWWLKESLDYAPFPSSWSLTEIKRAYADDAALPRNFFRHSPAHLALMQEGLHRKADATYLKLAERAG